MNKEKIKELFEGGHYYLITNDFRIRTKVKEVNIDNSKVCIYLIGPGVVDVYLDSIYKVSKIIGLSRTFSWCYKLTNLKGECIGYIGN